MEALVAERFPKPDVAPSLRKQPEPSPKAPSFDIERPEQPGAVPERQQEVPAAEAEQGMPTGALEAGSGMPATATEAPRSAVPAAAPEAGSGQPAAEGARAEDADGTAQGNEVVDRVESAQPAGAAGATARQAQLKPLSARRYLLKVSLSQEIHDKLRRAQDLVGGRRSDAELETVLEQALDALIAKRLKAKAGVGAKARRAGSEAKPAKARATEGAVGGEDKAPAVRVSTRGAGTAPATPTPTPARAASTPPGAGARYIPVALRRAVYTRDGGQCGFVDPNTGRRCQARSQLEFHHRVPFARGGAHSLENLCLVCRTHNAYHARRDFGDAHIEAALKGPNGQGEGATAKGKPTARSGPRRSGGRRSTDTPAHEGG